MTEFDQFLPGPAPRCWPFVWDNERAWDRVPSRTRILRTTVAAPASEALTQRQSRRHMRLLAASRVSDKSPMVANRGCKRLGSGRLDLLERRLVESHTTVVIPLDDRVLFVSLLNCAEFSSRPSEVAQTLDAISRTQFLTGGRGLGERWFLGTV
jgi:hypothetical protein